VRVSAGSKGAEKAGAATKIDLEIGFRAGNVILCLGAKYLRSPALQRRGSEIQIFRLPF
jgi:hypothetical protein